MANSDESAKGVVPLEFPCTYCTARGGWRVEGSGTWHRCTMCNGSGFIPTDFGSRVLDLLRHNFQSLLQDSHR